MNPSPLRSRRLRLWLGLPIAGAAIFLGLCWMAASRLISPSRRTLQDYHQDILNHASEHGMEIQPLALRHSDWKDTPCLVCIPSSQPGKAEKGRKLRAQLESEGIQLQPWGKIVGTLILLHGHTGCKEDHLPVAERLCAAGFRCLLVDLPGHGAHPLPYATFGIRETSLPSVVLSEAAERFAFARAPAGLFGISQGGAIALQAAAADQSAWCGVAELSAFSDLDSVISNQAKQWFGPLRLPARELVRYWVQKRAGYDPARVRPVDAASRIHSIPVLIGHGDEDHFVPPDAADQIFAAVLSDRKQFLTITGAGHHTVLVTPQPVYATLARFFLECLPQGT